MTKDENAEFVKETIDGKTTYSVPPGTPIHLGTHLKFPLWEAAGAVALGMAIYELVRNVVIWVST